MFQPERNRIDDDDAPGVPGKIILELLILCPKKSKKLLLYKKGQTWKIVHFPLVFSPSGKNSINI